MRKHSACFTRAYFIGEQPEPRNGSNKWDLNSPDGKHGNGRRLCSNDYTTRTHQHRQRTTARCDVPEHRLAYGVSSFGQYSNQITSLRASGGDNGGGSENLITNSMTVRRLTPMECERLQGYPDGWTDIGEWTDSKGKKHKESDGPRYKALGNSIALPFWEWMAERMINELQKSGEATPTMASLFDGIGGFPLVYSRHGCEPVWASEIEEFPMAVTRARFPEQ